MELPEIPQTYLIAFFLIAMVVMRCFGIDSWTTASLSSISAYLMGVKMEQTRK
jgi:hypothetical protein